MTVLPCSSRQEHIRDNRGDQDKNRNPAVSGGHGVSFLRHPAEASEFLPAELTVFLVVNDLMATGRAEIRVNFLKIRLLAVSPAVDHNGCPNPAHFFLSKCVRNLNRRDSTLRSSLVSIDLSPDETSATGGRQSFVQSITFIGGG